jgi:hypothetical protein
MWLSSVNCEQRYEVEYKYLWWQQNFLSRFPTYSFPKYNCFWVCYGSQCAVHFSKEKFDGCKWNVNTLWAPVRNFLLMNNFATWFLVLQKFLLHCVCVFGTGFNITSQFPKNQHNRVRTLYCRGTYFVVFFFFFETGLWYWTQFQKTHKME